MAVTGPIIGNIAAKKANATVAAILALFPLVGKKARTLLRNTLILFTVQNSKN